MCCGSEKKIQYIFMVCILKQYHPEQTKKVWAKGAWLQNLSRNCYLVDKQGEAKRSQTSISDRVCLTHNLKLLNPKSSTWTCLAQNTIRIGMVCVSLSDLTEIHHITEVKCTLLCCTRTGPETPKKTWKFPEEYMWNLYCDLRHCFHNLDFFSNASS